MPHWSRSVTQNQPDSHQSQPWACITFLSFKNKRQEDVSHGITEVRNITVVSDILNVSVQSDKNSYLMQASAVLSSGDLNYQSLITPGDHALIWIGDDKTQFESVSKAAANNSQANHYGSGLKFIGRVTSVRSIFNTTPNGVKTLRYAISFTAFTEFNSQIYFNPLLASAAESQGNPQDKAVALFANITEQWSQYIFNADDGTKFNIQKYIDFFIDIFFGIGPSKASKKIGKVSRSPNEAFLIPIELLSILGLTPSNEKAPNYSDALHTIIGIQKYTEASYLPLMGEEKSAVQSFTTDRLVGNMASPPDSFNSVPVWSLIKQFSNPSLNEVFNTIKMNKSGNIVPTFIARQIPFSTSNNPEIQNRPHTPFLDLPRWVLDPKMMINSFNIGVSESARFNYYQVNTQFSASNVTVTEINYLATSLGNQKLFENDIKRHGSHNLFMNTTADFTKDGVQIDARLWTELIADFYKNGHLKLTGSISTAGISAPICVGDNLKVTNKVFHIESLTHSYSAFDNGFKSFTTEMSLSHGILSDGNLVSDEAMLRENSETELTPGYNDQELYIGEKQITGEPPKKGSV